MPLPEEASTTHQRAAGSGPDEQHIELRELPSDRRCRAAVVRPPVLWIGVLIQPDVAVIGGAQRLDVVDPRTEQAADRIRFGDDMTWLNACINAWSTSCTASP